MKLRSAALFLLAMIAACSLFAGCGMFKVPSHTVTFYVGDAVVYQTETRSAKLVSLSTVKSQVEVPAGYTLEGFFDADGKIFAADYELGDANSFYARFALVTYTIAYDLGDGTATNPDTYTVETETFTLNAPVNNDETLVFAGWTTDDSGKPQKVVTIQKGTVGDLLFKANYEDSKKYYLYFDTVGGSEIDRLVSDNGVFNIPAQTPQKSGYNFVNWYVGKDYLIPVDNTYVAISKSSTIYAKWELITYSVTFENCDLSPIYFNVETETFSIPAAEKLGHEFLGYTQFEGASPVKNYSIPQGTHANIALTANFKVRQYTITFDSLGGSDTSPLTADFGSEISAPAAPQKRYCDFIGWYLDAACTDLYEFTTMPATNLTLYAGWYSDYNFTLTYSADGATATITSNRASGAKVTMGEEVVISAPAVAEDGLFSAWCVGDDVYSYQNELRFEMPYGDFDLTARYENSGVSAFTYAKNSATGVTVTNKSVSRIFGNSIAADDYEGATISADYLDALSDGNYAFSVLTAEGGLKVIIKVTGDGDGLSYLKIDYDVNYPAATLIFDGKPGYEYEYSLNSGDFAAAKSGMIIEGYDKSKQNRVRVRRVDDNADTIVVTKAGYTASYAAYYDQTFNYNAQTYDFVVEDYAELQAVMEYFAFAYAPLDINRNPHLSYAGGVATMKFFVDASFRTEFEANEKEYVTAVLSTKGVPYSPKYGYTYTRATSVETVNFYFTSSTLNELRSEQEVSLPSTEQGLAPQINSRAENYVFAIDENEKSQTIRTLYELENLALGVKPVFNTTNSDAYTVWEEARSVLRKYVADDMTEFQKITAIYDYLTTTITYDYAVASIAGAEGTSIGAYSSFTTYGALIEHVAVCDGISGAFRLLCLIEGIEADEITGYSDSGSGTPGGHAWNKVVVGGNYYGIDATWSTITITNMGVYVFHSNLFASECDLYASGHREYARMVDGALEEGAVENACVGVYDYFSIEIYGSNGLTRRIKKSNDLRLLVEYARTKGITVIEIKNDSFHESISALINSAHVSQYVTSTATLDDEEGIYLIFLRD